MTTLTHTRTFGCEIELTRLSIEQAAAALRAAGITTYDSMSNSMGPEPVVANAAPPVIPPYPTTACGCGACRREWAQSHGQDSGPRRPSQDEVKASWRVISDGSVSNGCEVVSPILSGNEGLAILRVVVRALKAAGAEVDNSCGFHVHVGATDLEGAEIINAVARYARHEREIDAFMAPRRRDSRSQWCRSMVPVATNMTENGGASTNTALANLVGGRYFKLNVHAFVRHGTLEFRQHAGTMNINKMINWIVFCVNFIEDSRLSSEFLTAYLAEAKDKRLTKMAFMLATTPSYQLRTWTLASYVGISEDNLGAMIDELKVKFPAYQGVRYDALNAAIHVPTIPVADRPVVPSESLSLPTSPGLFDSLPEDTTNYLRARAAGYASPLRRGIRATRAGVGA